MNFGYKEVADKRRNLASKKNKRVTSILITALKFVLYAIVLIIVVVGFTGLGMIKGIIDNALILFSIL